MTEQDKNSFTASINDNTIFFDGYCLLCIKSVALLLRADRKRMLRYTSLQGKFAHEVLTSRQIDSRASIIFRSAGRSYEKVEAVIQILFKLGGIYKPIGFLLTLFPFFISNKVYDLIARHRYRIFGKVDVCFIPKPEDQYLFLP